MHHHTANHVTQDELVMSLIWNSLQQLHQTILVSNRQTHNVRQVAAEHVDTSEQADLCCKAISVNVHHMHMPSNKQSCGQNSRPPAAYQTHAFAAKTGCDTNYLAIIILTNSS